MSDTPSLADVAARCESLGRNCEFGVVQRQLGRDDLISLLRWAGSDLERLASGFRSRFAGLAEKMTGAPEPPNELPERQHWMLTCARYGIAFHAPEMIKNASLEQSIARARPRLRWLADKLLTDIASAARTFVYSSAELSDPIDALLLVDAIRSVGGCPDILIVAQGHPQPIRPIWDCVWGARMPRLTAMHGAFAADMPERRRILTEVAQAIPASRTAASPWSGGVSSSPVSIIM